MSLKSLIHILIIILAALFDIALVSGLPFGLYRIHLVVIALVFVLLLGNVRLAAWWVLLAGFIFEAFSFKTFGVYLVSLGLVSGLIYILFEKVVTNRSLYAVGLAAAAGSLFYDLLFLLYNNLFSDVPLSAIGRDLGYELLGLAANAVIAVVIFYISSAVNRRLKPVFLTVSNI